MTGLLVPWGPPNPRGCWCRAITASKQQASKQSSLSHTRQPDRGLFPFQKILHKHKQTSPSSSPRASHKSLFPCATSRNHWGLLWADFAQHLAENSLYEASKQLSGKGAERGEGTEPSFSCGAAIRKPLMPTAKFKPNSEAVLLSWLLSRP